MSARSLRRYGQIAPIVVCLRDEVPVLVDGFKRLAAARGLKGFGSLSARRIEVDERSAKAAMYGLNRMGRHFGELEEAWLVQALVREDGLSQIEVAVLLGRHKSWVCRRLAMMEKLCGTAQEDLRLSHLVFLELILGEPATRSRQRAIERRISGRQVPRRQELVRLRLEVQLMTQPLPRALLAAKVAPFLAATDSRTEFHSVYLRGRSSTASFPGRSETPSYIFEKCVLRPGPGRPPVEHSADREDGVAGLEADLAEDFRPGHARKAEHFLAPPLENHLAAV